MSRSTPPQPIPRVGILDRRGSRRARTTIVLAAITALVATTASAGAAPARDVVGVGITGRTSLERVVSPTVLVDRGTVSGSPIGSGRVWLVYRLDPVSGVASTTFKIANRRGTVHGTASSHYSVTRLHITFTGRGAITRGTGAYAGIRGRPLAFGAIHSITGKREAISLKGRATTP